MGSFYGKFTLLGDVRTLEDHTLAIILGSLEEQQHFQSTFL